MLRWILSQLKKIQNIIHLKIESTWNTFENFCQKKLINQSQNSDFLPQLPAFGQLKKGKKKVNRGAIQI